MHTNALITKSMAIKIVQRTDVGKTKKFLLAFALLCAMLLSFFAIREAVCRVAASSWEEGREAWKRGDREAALLAWSRGSLAQPFAMRPARLYYWKIRALEKLRRDEEAALLASLLALRAPLDFYSFALAYDGKYPNLTRAAERALTTARAPRRYHTETAASSERTALRENIIFAVMKSESKFKPNAVSRRGALGLMQLMPPTAREAAKYLNDENLSPYEPSDNILLGAAHLSRLLSKYNGTLPLAIAAYNAGAAAVDKWSIAASDCVEWIEDVSYPQTREYLRSVLENIEIYDFAGEATQGALSSSFFAQSQLLPKPVGESFDSQYQ